LGRPEPLCRLVVELLSGQLAVEVTLWIGVLIQCVFLS
jgi:hypothetical protein